LFKPSKLFRGITNAELKQTFWDLEVQIAQAQIFSAIPDAERQLLGGGQ